MPDFGPRIRPEEVDSAVRAKLAKRVYRREFMALAAVFVPCLLLTALVVGFYRLNNEPAGSEWPLMAPIVVTVAVILIAIHVWSMRERRFIEKAPPAAAEVKEIESSKGCAHEHRLLLRYRPLQNNGTRIVHASESKLVVVEVESDLPGFSSQLYRGDALSILYDPEEPDHVCIVEEEHPAAA